MSGKKSKKAKSKPTPTGNNVDALDPNREVDRDTNDSDELNPIAAAEPSASPAMARIREVPRPRLMMVLAVTYAVWLGLLLWLARSIS